MNLGESVEDFLHQFLHLCYEFPKGEVDSNFIIEKFHSLILLTLRSFEFKRLDDFPFPTFSNHEAPQSSEDEPTIPLFPCPHPFPVLVFVPPSDDVDVGKNGNQIVDPSSPPSVTSHDLDQMEEISEWFMKPKVKANPLTFHNDLNTCNFNLNMI